MTRLSRLDGRRLPFRPAPVGAGHPPPLTENCTSEIMQNAENKKQEQGIKILGSGCAKCMELEKRLEQQYRNFN